MIPARILGATRLLGKEQDEYLNLPVRDELNPDFGPSMVTAWEPTPDELEILNKGGKVYLRILGTAHPPVMVTAELVE